MSLPNRPWNRLLEHRRDDEIRLLGVDRRDHRLVAGRQMDRDRMAAVGELDLQALAQAVVSARDEQNAHVPAPPSFLIASNASEVGQRGRRQSHSTTAWPPGQPRVRFGRRARPLCPHRPRRLVGHVPDLEQRLAVHQDRRRRRAAGHVRQRAADHRVARAAADHRAAPAAAAPSTPRLAADRGDRLPAARPELRLPLLGRAVHHVRLERRPPGRHARVRSDVRARAAGR